MSKSKSNTQTVASSQSNSSSNDENLDEQDPGVDDSAHRDPDCLEKAFEKYGTLAKTATHFNVSTTTIRKYLIRYKLYVPESQTEDSDHPVRARELEEMNPEDLGLAALGER